jgi:hypothetical protein
MDYAWQPDVHVLQARGLAEMFALQFVQSPPFNVKDHEWLAHLPILCRQQ